MLRLFALAVIALIAGSQGIASAADIDALLKDLKAKDPKTRLKAVEGIASIEGEKAVGGLCDGVFDTDAKVATAAQLALGKASPELAKHLVAIAVDKGVGNKSDAASKIGKLGDEAKPAIPTLASLAVKIASQGKTVIIDNPKLGVELIHAISALGIDSDNTAKKMAAIVEMNADKPMRTIAIGALANWSKASEDNQKLFFTTMKNWLNQPKFTTDVELMISACRAIGLQGADAKKDFGPALEKMKLSISKPLREEAEKALAEIEKPKG